MPFFALSPGTVRVRHEAQHSLKVRWNEPGEAPYGPCASYLSTGTMVGSRPQQLAVTVTARDQAWGNSGHSYIAVALRDSAGAVKCTERVMTTRHAWAHCTGVFDASSPLLSTASDGDYYDLMAVSGPYAGLECVCNSAMVEIVLTRVG